MSYAELSHIESEFKDVDFSTNTSVSDDNVEAFIEEFDAIIDGYIGQKYTVPVASGGGLLILRRICIGLVTNRIKSILYVKTGNESPDQNVPDPNEEFYDMLKKIQDGDLLLAGATNISPTGSVAFNQSICEPHTFKKGEAQW